MGIFNFFKSKKEVAKITENTRKVKKTNDLLNVKKEQRELLSKLKINPYDYKHENMESVEISLSEELDGAIEISDFQSEDTGNEFDYISLTDYKNGKKSLYLSQTNREERAIKILIDKYSNEFGEDKITWRKEFTKCDLIQMDENLQGHLREWYLDEFHIIIGYNYSSKILSNYMLVNERI